MKKYSVFVLLLLLFQIFSSCKKEDTITDPGTEGTLYNFNASGQPIPDLTPTANLNGIMTTISYDIYYSTSNFLTYKMAFAQFGTGVDAGTVAVNGRILNAAATQGKSYYIAGDPLNPQGSLSSLNFDGSSHNWSISGGSGIPQITNAVNSPIAFSITSPSNNSTVSRSGQLNITWNSTSQDSRILVYLVSMQENKYYISQENYDNGSLTIPASKITTFPAGGAILYIVRYRYSTHSGSDGKVYLLISEIVKLVNITLA